MPDTVPPNGPIAFEDVDADSFSHGDAYEPSGDDDGPLGPEPPPHGPAESAAVRPLRVVSPTQWQGRQAPAREWLIEDLIPMGRVTTLSAPGGTGKTLLAQQLMTCTAIGRPWLDLPVRAARSIGLFSEDDDEEMQIRQEVINRHYGIDMRDLDAMELMPRLGESNYLMTFERGVGELAPFFFQLLERGKTFGARFVVIDTKSDAFGGNLINAIHARQFMQHCLGSLARELRAAVLLLDHPSVRGRNSGDGDGGSVQWGATARSQLYLTAPRRDDEDPDRDYRELKTTKANFGPTGDTLALRWEHGVFIRADAPVTRPKDMVQRLDLDNRLLAEMRAMIEAGAKLPLDFISHRGFANVVRKRPGFDKLKQDVVVQSQQRLLKTGRAVAVTVGPPSKACDYIRPADMQYPGEKPRSAA